MEQTVDVSKVNPNNCSYTEMLALNAHTGNKSDSNFMTMSILKDKMDGTSDDEIVEKLEISHGMAESTIRNLKDEGKLVREGSTKAGKWIIKDL